MPLDHGMHHLALAKQDYRERGGMGGRERGGGVRDLQRRSLNKDMKWDINLL